MRRILVVLVATMLLVGAVRGYIAARERPRYPCSFRNEHGKLISLTEAQKARTRSVKLGKGMGVQRVEVTEKNSIAVIRCVATHLGMDPAPFVQVAQCESHADPEAVNPAGPYYGIYQYLPATWAAVSAANGHKGAPATDGYAMIHSTVRHVREHGWGQWGICI